jgi:adenylosuccinate synthase
MTKVIAVIGANYGDEGKGAVTNFLTKQHKSSLTVRFNGGPQAGHTVQIKPNKKHVFSSYGSGTFQGASTYLSEHVLFNPRAAHIERGKLEDSGLKLQPLVVNPDCVVISPWDIAMNQFLELGRGSNKHGSCGMGIGETMLRKTTPGAPIITAGKLQDPLAMMLFCKEMAAWFKKRAKEESEKNSLFDLTHEEKTHFEYLVNYPSELATEMISWVGYMFSTKTLPFSALGSETVIFEGAQGLLLDEDDPDHQPHVSWSKTGLKNVVDLCTKYELDLAEVYYVTRPYLTRHGQGPFWAGLEIPTDQVPWDQDLTNKTNKYQGPLRYGHLDWNKLRTRIQKDLTTLKDTKFKPKINLALTCFDQIYSEEQYSILKDWELTQCHPDDLLPRAEVWFETMNLVVVDGLNG